MKTVTVLDTNGVKQSVILSPKHHNSEHWLQLAANEVAGSIDIFFNNRASRCGFDTDRLKLIKWHYHFATKGNRSAKRENIEVLLDQVVGDGSKANVVTISNRLSDEFDLLAQVILGMAYVGFNSTNSRVTNFKSFLRFYGLDATRPSKPEVTDSFKSNCIGWIEGLGAFPSKSVEIAKNRTTGSRQMLSGQCTGCGFRCSALRGQLEKHKIPLCGDCNIPITFPKLETELATVSSGQPKLPSTAPAYLGVKPW